MCKLLFVSMCFWLFFLFLELLINYGHLNVFHLEFELEFKIQFWRKHNPTRGSTVWQINHGIVMRKEKVMGRLSNHSFRTATNNRYKPSSPQMKTFGVKEIMEPICDVQDIVLSPLFSESE